MPARMTARSNCPIAKALDIVGDHWTLLIIRDLALKGGSRFGDFLNGGEGISTNILSDRLQLLGREGLVFMQPDPLDRRQKLYHLTEKGIALLPLLVDLILWGAEHCGPTDATAEFLARAKDDRAALLGDLQASLQRRLAVATARQNGG